MSEIEKKWKRLFLVMDRECFALSHFIFTNQSFVSVSSTVKVEETDTWLVGSLVIQG